MIGHGPKGIVNGNIILGQEGPLSYRAEAVGRTLSRAMRLPYLPCRQPSEIPILSSTSNRNMVRRSATGILLQCRIAGRRRQ